MKIIYLISTIILIISFILLNKYDQKQNIIKWVILSTIIFFCYNAVIVFLLSLLKISAFIWLRTVINLIISSVFSFFIIRSKRVQSYYIKAFDILVVILFCLLAIFIYNYRFKNNAMFFETTDPAVHFVLGERFYKTSSLSMNNPQELFYSTKSFDLFTSYTALGTVFQLSNNNNVVDHIHIFIIFELVIITFSGLVLFFMATEKQTKVFNKIFILLLAITYIAGYPLNNLIFGFHYLGMSILLTSVIFDLLITFYKNENKKFINYLVIAIANFNLFTLYYLFVPIIYGAEGLYVLYNSIFLKKRKLKNSILDIIYILLIPFIVGIIMYFVFPRINTHDASPVGAFKAEGYIYRNLIGNFILLVPIMIYSFINRLKQKQLLVIHFALPLICIFMITLFVLIYKTGMATYYYYKFYYLLSLLCFVILGFDVAENKFGIFQIFSSYLCLLMLFQFFNVEERVSNNNYLLNPVSSISNVNAVLQNNQVVISTHEPIYSKQQLKDLKGIQKVIQKNDIRTGNVVFIADTLKKLWFYSLFDISATENETFLYSYYEDTDINAVIKNDKYKYLILLNGYEDSNIYKVYSSLYENSSFTVLKRINSK